MKKRILLGVVIVIVLAIASYILFSTFEVSGVEFCPQTFERRNFTYHKGLVRAVNMDRGIPLPWASQSITKHLKSNTAVKRWDLVSGSWIRGSKVGDSQILMQYLDGSSASTSWNLAEWSNDHPELAAELWPRIQMLAIHHLYFAVPDVIGYAQRKSISVDEFQKLADQRILTAAMEQLRHLLANETPTDISTDRQIYLLRLTQWLDGQKDIDDLLDQSQAGELNSLRGGASLLLRGVQDGMLSNEEVPAPATPSLANPPTPNTSAPTPSANAPTP